jgi:hypothetical protein
MAFTAAVLFAKLFLQVATPEVRGYDFSAMYVAGYMVREGKGSRLYDLVEQTRAEEAIFKRPGLMVIVHPPFEALFFAPLARISYVSAYLVWGVVNIFLWMLFVYIARSFAPVPRQTFQYMLLCFTFFPLWVTLLQGQTSLLLLILYSLTYASLKRRQDFRAGALLGLGLFRFQLVLPFALICLIRRKWRMMAGFAVVALMLGALSIVAVGPSGVVSYLTLLVNMVTHPANAAYTGILPSDMPTVRGVLSVLMAGHLAPTWINATVALVSGFLIVFTAELWRRRDRLEGNGSLGLMFGAALAVTLTTGFHLSEHDLSLLLLAIFLAIGSPQWSRKRPWRTVLNVSIAVLYLPPVYLLLREWGRLYLLWPVLFAFALASFVLLGERQEVPTTKAF